MSEKNSGDESPLRPVESDNEPDATAEGTDWMDALGVGRGPTGDKPEAVSDSDEPEESTSNADWIAQLGGDDPSPIAESGGDSPASDPPGDEVAWAQSPPSPGQKRRRERSVAVAVVAGFVVLVVGVGLLLVAQMSGGDTSEPTDLAADLAEIEAGSGAPVAPTAAAGADFECEESDSEAGVTGSGAGDTESVAGVILAFEHAYYSTRDADKALELTSDDSPLVDVDALQEGIDSVPAGTEHCVSITADGDTAKVEITEARPSQAPEIFVQEITTSRDGDQVEIVDVVEVED